MKARETTCIDIHVGARLRLRRMCLGMSQQELARSLDLTFQQIQKYEKGVNRIGACRLYTAARILGVDVPYFFEEAPDQPAVSQIPVNEDTHHLQGFVQRRDGLQFAMACFAVKSPRVRKCLLNLMQALQATSAK